MSDVFVNIRNQPEMYGDINFRMQNVSFVLNVIDVLAGEMDYPKVRRHVPTYATLRLVEEQAEIARSEAAAQRKIFQDRFDEELQTAEGDVTKAAQDLEKKVQEMRNKGIATIAQQKDLQRAVQEFQTKRVLLSRGLEVKKEQLEQARDANIAKEEAKMDRQIRDIQNRYKMLAVFIPPIPPLLVGIVVLVSRRLREREGISKTRLK